MRKRKKVLPGTLLELWRAPKHAGEAVGCLTSTYTFQPGVFDEQCLGRFFDMESDPDREDLAYFLEREHHLGSAYVGVLVDHTQAGVEHSLRWDLMPVRIPNGKQHAKLTVLAWENCVRVIVGSANMTEPGYRFNREVAVALDSTPDEYRTEVVGDACQFLRRLLTFEAAQSSTNPTVKRAKDFLDAVQQHVSTWTDLEENDQVQQLTFTLPGRSVGPPISTLKSTLASCTKFGGQPDRVDVASPFFDEHKPGKPDAAAGAMCQAFEAGTGSVRFCVPSKGGIEGGVVRLLAPESLVETAEQYDIQAQVAVLPVTDEDRNARVWHAKMMAFDRAGQDGYCGLLIGSSNFTKAGLGVDVWNAEANLLTLVRSTTKVDVRLLRSVWPTVDSADGLDIEWLGPSSEHDEESSAAQTPLPQGFRSAIYRAAEKPLIIIELNDEKLPASWQISTAGSTPKAILDEADWAANGRNTHIEICWDEVSPPTMLHVHWTDKSGDSRTSVLTLNVEDAATLPPPDQVSGMTADEMLMILAASDPGAAFRVWARIQQDDSAFDEDLDSCENPDLDPLRRYDLRATFLRRIRNRARVLAKLRLNLQQPVATPSSLRWRLEGFIGVKALTQRLLAELTCTAAIDEAVLNLSDLMIVLMEVKYESADGRLSQTDFDLIYGPFLIELISEADQLVQQQMSHIGKQVSGFWARVVERGSLKIIHLPR